jgi:hypothetical protein
VKRVFGTRDAPLSQEGMASLNQIHSGLVLIAREAGCAGDGDALVTDQPGLALSIRTADCYPILLASPKAVAAIHAGWRGTDARIVERTITRLHTEYSVEPREIFAAIGPGIGACCYQVGVEVARRFGLDRAGKLDLAAENLGQLLGAGVPRPQIEVSGQCTFCDPARFHSYRRDGEAAGRMISYIRID